MVFDNTEQLEQHLYQKMLGVIMKIQDYVEEIINGFLQEYYMEYAPSPDGYERTFQFLHSVVKSNIKGTNNGFLAYVYIDYDRLNYKDWTGYEVVYNAGIQGEHGGVIVKDGTKVWIESLQTIKKYFPDYVKQSCKRYGIPVM